MARKRKARKIAKSIDEMTEEYSLGVANLDRPVWTPERRQGMVKNYTTGTKPYSDINNKVKAVVNKYELPGEDKIKIYNLVRQVYSDYDSGRSRATVIERGRASLRYKNLTQYASIVAEALRSVGIPDDIANAIVGGAPAGGGVPAGL